MGGFDPWKTASCAFGPGEHRFVECITPDLVANAAAGYRTLKTSRRVVSGALRFELPQFDLAQLQRNDIAS